MNQEQNCNCETEIKKLNKAIEKLEDKVKDLEDKVKHIFQYGKGLI